jgi:hypothetical protein
VPGGICCRCRSSASRRARAMPAGIVLMTWMQLPCSHPWRNARLAHRPPDSVRSRNRSLTLLSHGSECRTSWRHAGCAMPLSFPNTGDTAEFVGQADSLRRTQRWKGTPPTRLPTSLFKPPRRVDNPPQVDNLPHIRHLAGLNRCLFSACRKTKWHCAGCVRHNVEPGCEKVRLTVEAQMRARR